MPRAKKATNSKPIAKSVASSIPSLEPAAKALADDASPEPTLPTDRAIESVSVQPSSAEASLVGDGSSQPGFVSELQEPADFSQVDSHVHSGVDSDVDTDVDMGIDRYVDMGVDRHVNSYVESDSDWATELTTQHSTQSAAIDLSDPQFYFNRELSWLEFNNRVLHEAFDPRTPLLERLRYLAIFASNLDEFFMVRVAALKQQLSGSPKVSPDRGTPDEQLRAIADRLRPLVAQHQRHFEQALRPQLTAKGIYLFNYGDLPSTTQEYLQQYFEAQIFPVLTPLAIDPSHPFPYISNLSLNLAVVVRDRETGISRFARVKVPNLLPRFIPLPAALSHRHPVIWAGVPIEQVIAHHLSMLFPEMEVVEHSLFRITRNAELGLEDSEDLLRSIEQELRRRQTGATALRLEIEASASLRIRHLLMQELELAEADVYHLQGLLRLRDLRFLSTLPLPELKYAHWSPIVSPALRRVHLRHPDEADSESTRLDREDIFSAIRRRDILLHHPYEAFSASVELFIKQAAIDPNVLTIKMTLYRTSADLAILNALVEAAENGKQVTVLVELQARFDEANNIQWARKLEQAGVHVVYGLVGLKTHAKVILVVRQEGESLRRYVHIGTGDYNPRTAKLYADVGLLSCCSELGSDLSELFNYLTGYSRQMNYRKLLVAPVNLRDRLVQLMQREAQFAQQGIHARMVAKLGAITDPTLIRSLYLASQQGVKIDLIVQGMCCLRPGVIGVSDNIRVISIVGRFLEHSRILYFHNGGQPEVYLGSADWMRRNFEHRVEVLVPIENTDLSQELQILLGTLLADNRHAWELQPNGRYIQRQPRSPEAEINAQRIFVEMARQSIVGS
ncbi:MAG: polyphosphate kinase 1 [Elainella sp. Prado103]|jgi:polyphosphate kinase|nr:polyphosphate kinase 1 [Elainella sp. Prado103]